MKWMRERDLLIAQTMAFVQSVTGRKPEAEVFARTDLTVVTATRLPDVEAMLAEQAGHSVYLVDGDPRNLKITTPEDLEIAERLAAANGRVASIRIGNGYDLHRLVAGRQLILGGVAIPFDKGLEGHSDGDAVCHAVTDAILGAASAGDIGRHFPDTDAVFKGANSIELLMTAAACSDTRSSSRRWSSL